MFSKDPCNKGCRSSKYRFTDKCKFVPHEISSCLITLSVREGRFYLIISDLNGRTDFIVCFFPVFRYFTSKSSVTYSPLLKLRILLPLSTPLGVLRGE